MTKLSPEAPSLDFRMLLAIRNFLDDHSADIKYYCKSKKQYELFINNLINYLLTNNLERDKFVEYGGNVNVRCSNDNKQTILNLIF